MWTDKFWSTFVTFLYFGKGPPLSKDSLRALYQMDIWNKRNRSGKRSIWLVQLKQRKTTNRGRTVEMCLFEFLLLQGWLKCNEIIKCFDRTRPHNECREHAHILKQDNEMHSPEWLMGLQNESKTHFCSTLVFLRYLISAKRYHSIWAILDTLTFS